MDGDQTTESPSSTLGKAVLGGQLPVKSEATGSAAEQSPLLPVALYGALKSTATAAVDEEHPAVEAMLATMESLIGELEAAGKDAPKVWSELKDTLDGFEDLLEALTL